MALRRIISALFMPCFVCELHTLHEVWYAASRTPVFLVRILRFKKPKVLFAFEVMLGEVQITYVNAKVKYRPHFFFFFFFQNITILFRTV